MLCHWLAFHYQATGVGRHLWRNKARVFEKCSLVISPLNQYCLMFICFRVCLEVRQRRYINLQMYTLLYINKQLTKLTLLPAQPSETGWFGALKRAHLTWLQKCTAIVRPAWCGFRIIAYFRMHNESHSVSNAFKACSTLAVSRVLWDTCHAARDMWHAVVNAVGTSIMNAGCFESKHFSCVWIFCINAIG